MPKFDFYPRFHDTTFDPLAIYFNTNTGTTDSSGNSRTLTATTVANKRESYSSSQTASYYGGEYTRTDSGLKILGDLTISVLMKLIEVPASTTHSHICYYAGSGELESGNYAYYYAINDDLTIRSFHEYGAGINEDYSTSCKVPLNQWFHLAITRNTAATLTRIYINSYAIEDINYATNPTGATSADFVLGGPENVNSMNSFAIYDKALVQEEVTYLCRRLLGR